MPQVFAVVKGKEAFQPKPKTAVELSDEQGSVPKGGSEIHVRY
jgi:hypothetical protein